MKGPVCGAGSGGWTRTRVSKGVPGKEVESLDISKKRMPNRRLET